MLQQSATAHDQLFISALNATRQELKLNEHVSTVYETHIIDLAIQGHQDLENIDEEEFNALFQEGLLAGEFELHDWVDDFIDLKGVIIQALKSGDLSGAGETIMSVLCEQAKQAISQQLHNAYESLTC